jgi:hypothetical protein
MIGNFAVVENETVTNVIVVAESNASAFSQAIGKELYSANEIPLTIGDYRKNNMWYRMIDGKEIGVI